MMVTPPNPPSIAAMAKRLFFTQPQPRSFLTGNRAPYTGEQLREIRKRKGVGRPPETWGSRSLSRSLQAWQANRMAAKLPPFMTQERRDMVAKWWPMPIYQANLAEWNRKRRRGETDEQYRDRILAGMMAGIDGALVEMGYERA